MQTIQCDKNNGHKDKKCKIQCFYKNAQLKLIRICYTFLSVRWSRTGQLDLIGWIQIQCDVSHSLSCFIPIEDTT